MTSIKSKVINFAPAIAGLLFLVAVPYALGSVVTSLATKIIIFALLAMALDIVFGYTGLWSFCHAALFGVGGYTVAMIVNYTDITSFFVIAPAGIIMATIAAAIFGLIALRASGIYFLLITVALGQLVFGSIITQFQWTKGYDGFGRYSVSRNRFISFNDNLLLFCSGNCRYLYFSVIQANKISLRT